MDFNLSRFVLFKSGQSGTQSQHFLAAREMRMALGQFHSKPWGWKYYPRGTIYLGG